MDPCPFRDHILKKETILVLGKYHFKAEGTIEGIN